MGSAKTWIALLSAGGLVWVSLGDFSRTSPGPLAASHAGIAALAGHDSCAQCHGGWFGSMADACLDCHDDVKEHVDSGRGLHGLLARRDGVDVNACARCHSDHHGAGFLMANRQSFALAGIEDVEQFDHALIGYEMKGRHKELTCGRCHHHADLDVLQEGQKRYLGLSRECASCHDDPHEGRFGASCTDCHNQESFAEVHPVEHDRFLPLVGGHGGLSCAQCHEPGTPYAVEGRVRRGDGPDRTCTDCHASPHEEAFVADTTCADCHEAEHETFAAAAETLSAAQHEKSGFSLARPHDEASCRQCHQGSYLPFEQRYPGRAADDCRSCHDDPHGGQFDDGLFQRGRFREQGCLACHGRHEFLPHRFTDRMHAQAGFALDGAHKRTDCHACHERPEKDAPRRFDGTSRSCAACHADAHRGAFRGRAGSCSVCHTTNEFREHRRPFHHGKWTGFPLGGAHKQETCAACHKRTKKPDETGRTFGRVEGYRGCVTCHEDPHRGAFQKQGFDSCADCHTDVSFRVLPKRFDHGAATGFPLDGAHGEVSCSQCHPRLREPDRFGRTWKPARGTRCADCHADPHAGQFRVKGATDCRRCHQSTMSFSRLDFDHQTDTRFPLDEQHEDVSCAGCHKTERTKRGQFVRYKPLGTRCVDCHKAQRDPLRRDK